MSEPDDYEPPRLDVIGSLVELTQGVSPSGTDNVLLQGATVSGL